MNLSEIIEILRAATAELKRDNDLADKREEQCELLQWPGGKPAMPTIQAQRNSGEPAAFSTGENT